MSFFAPFTLRYRKYIEPFLDVYGLPSHYAQQKISNLLAFKDADVCFIYAGLRNLGDHLSFLGLKSIVPMPCIQLFASGIALKQLYRTLTRSRRNLCLVIGGGGLFQPVFQDFWEIILNARHPFFIFGVGINKLGRQRSLSDFTLLPKIINNAVSVRVRDQMTFQEISKYQCQNMSIGICPSISYLYPTFLVPDLNNNNTLLHITHPADMRLSDANLHLIRTILRKSAHDNDLQYEETDNITFFSHKTLSKYRRARVVISSRLHGCIISYGIGVPFASMDTDAKIRAFLETHAINSPIYPVDSFHDQQKASQIVSDLLRLNTSYDAYIKSELLLNIQHAKSITAFVANSI